MHQKILMWTSKKLSISQIQSCDTGRGKCEIVESWTALFTLKASLSPW